MCFHLLWVHKKGFADSWLFLNNFKPLLHSHHCISAPDWMQTRSGCPGLGRWEWRVEIPCPARATCGCHIHQWVSTVAASKQLHLVSCSIGQFCLNPKILPIKHAGKGAEGKGRGRRGVSELSPLSCHRSVAVGMGTGPSYASQALQGNPAPSEVTESFSLPGSPGTLTQTCWVTETHVSECSQKPQSSHSGDWCEQKEFQGPV